MWRLRTCLFSRKKRGLKRQDLMTGTEHDWRRSPSHGLRDGHRAADVNRTGVLRESQHAFQTDHANADVAVSKRLDRMVQRLARRVVDQGDSRVEMHADRFDFERQVAE